MQHPRVPVGHDAFRDWVRRGDGWCTKGLGKTSQRILEFLLAHAHEGPHTQVVVAAGLGVNRATVGRNLVRLIGQGLVTKEKRGISATVISGKLLDSLATEMGLAGASMRQRRRYGWDLLNEGSELHPEVAARTQVQSMINRGRAHPLLPEVSSALGVEDLQGLRSTLPEARACPHRSPCEAAGEDGVGGGQGGLETDRSHQSADLRVGPARNSSPETTEDQPLRHSSTGGGR
jgi:hypothetical protein